MNTPRANEKCIFLSLHFGRFLLGRHQVKGFFFVCVRVLYFGLDVNEGPLGIDVFLILPIERNRNMPEG